MKKLIYVYNKLRGWDKRDITILEKKFRVVPIKYSSVLDSYYIYKEAKGNSTIYVWFASGMSFMCNLVGMLTRTKVYLVAGGPMILNEKWRDLPKFGVKYSYRRKLAAELSVRLSHKVLTVSNYEYNAIMKRVGKDKLVNIYHGFDIEKYKQKAPKEFMVSTIATIREDYLIRKGLIGYINVAKKIPKIPFYVIGKFQDDSYLKLKNLAPKNVILTGYIPDEELINILSKSKVYVQLSTQEGFGCAIAEAMLCNCIPVTSKYGAIHEVVGGTGFYVNPNDIDDITSKVEKALFETKSNNHPRSRIISNFSLNLFESKLLEIVD